ncbi:Lnb N-terminal periplasmic domain-containing protein [Ancylomarina longa]|uniref:DUF4105 domain-containing protein n=1 Tax=Ancylomarina longa TaxID=2487017 RepID=A0A434AF34_9BACT|nr:DUF4105 domain-containing protein [Ancylomarina longa]RUT72984.1 DUF4105 domain-containing protein [Ancylomarina longa]
MKQRSTLLSLLILITIILFGKQEGFGRDLSNKAEISILTCSPGDELYSQFGHSAIRVNDPVNQLDLVFNYGTFDFNTPNFYMKFARGKLNYMLSYTSYNRFKKEYIYENRGIIEQKLNLDQKSIQNLFNALAKNYQPENRFYQYDFLFDNCSTRIRDIIEANTSQTIKFEQSTTTDKTFWNLLDPYMENSRWIFLGIHLALGLPCDSKAAPYQYMFLPDHLMSAFDQAKISNENKTPLVKSTQTVLKPRLQIHGTKFIERPAVVFSIIAIIGFLLSIYYYNKQGNLFAFDIFLFGATGLLGWVILFLWFLTDHQATGPNLNILWAFPFHFPMVLFLLKKKKNRLRIYFLCNSILLLITLSLWKFIPQSLPNEILPLVALLLFRSLYISKKLKSINIQ